MIKLVKMRPLAGPPKDRKFIYIAQLEFDRYLVGLSTDAEPLNPALALTFPSFEAALGNAKRMAADNKLREVYFQDP